jgi:predicted amidohydrolase YtcJ
MSELVLLGARLLDPATGRLLPHTALAAVGGRISRLGDDGEVRALAGGAATVIDVKGSVVIPGLTDGHMHPVSGAERTTGTDLSSCPDLASAREALAGTARALAPGAWLRGWGLDPNVFGAEAVTSGPFGPILDGIPAATDLFDGHSMLASPRALELAGIDGPRRFGQAAEVVCDDAGRPTGLLLEDAACALVAGARHRRPSRDLSEPPHGLDQALTPLQALRGMTVSPAWAAGEEGSAGRLAVGCRADLTVLADDPLRGPDEDLAALPVLLTVLGGRVTYRTPGL